MNQAEYNAIKATNWSRLKSMSVSPLQFLHDSETDRADTTSLGVGRGCHMMVLEPKRAAREIVVYEGTRRGKAWDAFQGEHLDCEIMIASEWERAKGAADAVLRHPIASRHLSGSAEQLVQWTDAETGLPCKCRTDMLSNRLTELKTDRDIDPRKFAANFARYMYHGQLAFYHDGLIAAGHHVDENPILIMVQNVKPHDVVVYFIPDEVLEAGRSLYRGFLNRYRDCIERGEWPGIAEDRELTFFLPEWALDEANNDEPVVLTMGGEAIAL